MTGPAAIQASLVDVRNVATHKCVRLELHVPVEHAALVMRAFGWPTAADPVPVAVARLDMSKAAARHDAPTGFDKHKERTPWVDTKPSAQAAIRCNEAAFQSFMRVTNSQDAARYVREACGVQSRAELDTQETAAARWRELDGRYERERRGGR